MALLWGLARSHSCKAYVDAGSLFSCSWRGRKCKGYRAYAETLDALAAHGVVSRSAATAAKAVLSLLANNPENGGPPDVDVPLKLKYRTLSMRQVPLVRLPELDWP